MEIVSPTLAACSQSRSPAGRAAEGGSTGADLVPVRAELVVARPLLGVAEDLVRLVQILKFLLRRLVSRVKVGVIFSRKLPVCLLDFIHHPFLKMPGVIPLEIMERPHDHPPHSLACRNLAR